MNEEYVLKDLQKKYRRRWSIWIVAILAHTIGLFHRAAMAPMADLIMADFDITAVAFGSLAAVYFYVYAAMQIPSGTLADTLGPRKTITAGLLLSSAGSIVMGLSPTFTIIYLGRLLVSFGVSVTWISVLKLLTEWFRSRELGTITGFSGCIANLGQIAAATPLALLVIWIGWRMSFMTIAGISLTMAVANWFIIRDNPAKIGLPAVSSLNRQAISQPATAGSTSNFKLVQKFKLVFSNKQLWPLFMISSGIYGSYTTLIHNWAVIYLVQSYSIHRDHAANFVLVAAIGIMLGSPLVGFLSDRLSRRKLPIVIFTSLSLISFLLLTLWNGGKAPLIALYPLCFFIGFGTGAMPVLFATISDLTPSSVRGIASGLVNSGGFLAAAIAQPLFGHILDQGWKGEIAAGVRVYPPQAFQHSLLLCCALAGVGFLGALLMKETHCSTSYDRQTWPNTPSR